MKKELEALDYLFESCDEFKYMSFYPKIEDSYNAIKQDLLELKAIEEAEPSEALECVAVLKEDGCITTLYQAKALETIRKTLLKAQKFKKAWEIVKEKHVDLKDLRAYFKVERGLQEYNRHQYKEDELTEEEFDLLKEALE